ncbi:PTS ascorbate transporter subunit IIC [Collinsella sp. zg1085]|uniref:PTS ascorbate transporter subunit IIC n=1 Tax=Collinsella sp. zg1085 TaxID=2844380 RepID=UPI001C0BBF62|nr:PTS ascorbate transporter subunit IIC [Collinsella sp. zg1085]QWT17539.1 PTS ascorbate transporter subunit IIC [Collinsella sp. zg1085]
MDIILYVVQNYLSQSVFIIGLVVVVGMLALKKSWSQIFPSAIKAMIGFTMVNLGGQTLGMTLLPLATMIAKAFGASGEASTDVASASAEYMAEIGTELALIFAFGFLINLLLARFTKFKYVHLSAHVSFFFSGLIAALLTYNTSLPFWGVVGVGSVLLGCYMTLTCAYCNWAIQGVKGAEGFTIAHSSSIGCLVATLVAKQFGNKEQSLETIEIPKQFSFLREMTIALTLVMSLLFLVVCAIANPAWVSENISGGKDILVFSILQGISFGMWITVIITGVRMMLSEIIPAFHGIADKVIPGAKPGLDVPLLFPNYPTCVIVGFLCSLASGLVGMVVLAAVGYPVIVFPALIPTFFTGAITAIFGEAHGGARGAVMASLINGVLLIVGQALLLPLIGSYAPIMRILSETDYCVYGPLLGFLLKMLPL